MTKEIQNTYAGKIENLISTLSEINKNYFNGKNSYTLQNGTKHSISDFVEQNKSIHGTSDVGAMTTKIKNNIYLILDKIGETVPKIYKNTIKMIKDFNDMDERIDLLDIMPFSSSQEKEEERKNIEDRYFPSIDNCGEQINESLDYIKDFLKEINVISVNELGEQPIFDKKDIEERPGELAMQLMTEYNELGQTLTQMINQAKNHSRLQRNMPDATRINPSLSIASKYDSLINTYYKVVEIEKETEIDLKRILGSPKRPAPESMDLHIVKELPPGMPLKTFTVRMPFIDGATSKYKTEDVVLAFPDKKTAKLSTLDPHAQENNKEVAYILKTEWNRLTRGKVPFFEGEIIDQTGAITPWNQAVFKGDVKKLLIQENYLIETNIPNVSSNDKPNYINPLLTDNQKKAIFDKIVNQLGLPYEKLATYLSLRVKRATPNSLNTKKEWEHERHLASQIVTEKNITKTNNLDDINIKH